MKRRVRLAVTVSLLALAGSALSAPEAATAAGAGGRNAPATAASTSVIDGSARFEVLTPTLIRMEYAGDGRFQDAETFNAVNRSFPAVPSEVQQDVSAVPSGGTYQLSVRYANAQGGDGQSITRTLSTTVNGAPGPTLSMPVTGSWDTWSTVSVPVTLNAGVNTIGIVQNAADSGNVNLDSLAVTATGAGYPAPGASSALLTTAYGAGPTDTLGGWSSSLDNQNPATATERPGILDRDGWYLLDDSRSAVLNADGSVTDRPGHGGQPYQDGYFFGYGANYKQGLSDLNALTGNTNLLPESAYGVWYSRYYAYSTADYENTLLPTFRSTFTPLDWLVVDTDWKSPNQWNGWNWNSSLFPDPNAFMTWTRQQGLETAFNIHVGINSADPQFPAANATAGGLSPDPTRGGGDYEFDWSNPNQLQAYFNLHKPFEQQGVREWWLDYCWCGNSTASDPHVAPGNFINQAYAQDGTARGLRGFAFGRIGSSAQAGDNGNYALGPWSERRNSMQFTGDTEATWAMMALEARFAGDEAAAGVSNVSNDIGSFHGDHLADDMYARWVQLGTFQPIDRLHSDHGDRLPWNYGAAADASAERFLRLREALVPYTYTLAAQANATGVPIIRPLYLDYPSNSEAYSNKGEYLYGDNVLVAPITTADDANGNGSVSAWIPPGTWTDYFTGTSYTGPATVTITDPLSQMPVLIKSGGIMPQRTNYVTDTNFSPLTQVTLSVAAGADGSFALYQDAGEGNGYQSGQSTTTPISWSDASRTLTIGADTGAGFSGAATQRSYTLRLSNTVAPTAVFVDGIQVPETAWAYNPNQRTTTVTTGALPVGSAHTISLTGSATANPTSGEVVGDAGLCLDTRGGTTTNGTAMQLYTCNHSAAQQFTYTANGTTGGTLRVLGKCVDAANAGTANGTAVQLYDCNTTGSQNWVAQSNGELMNPQSGRCLTVPGGNTTPGAVQLQLQDCSGGAPQVWKLPPGPVTGPGGLCVDVANADPSYATSVQLWSCNQTDAQRWYTPGDQTVRVFGKCLDVTFGGTASGTRVQLYDCNGSGSQVWVTQPNGSLLNPQSGRCLDDPNNNEKAGDLLQIYDCDNTSAQQFSLGG